MRAPYWFAVLGLIGVGGLCCAAPPAKRPHPSAPAKVSYYRQIRPILMAKCMPCHSAQNHAGLLDLSTYAAFLKGGAHGPALVKGHPEKSLVIGYLHGKPQLMPKGGPPLPKAEIALFERWIAQGARNDTPPPHSGKKPGKTETEVHH